MRTTKKILPVLMTMLMLTLALFSCKKKTPSGEVQVKLTDDPVTFPFISSVDVTIGKVELKNAETDEYITVFDGQGTYNIAGLTNGQTASLQITTLPAGDYDEVKVTITSVDVTLTDSRHFTMNFNGGITADSDIKPELHVANNGSAELLLDFDLAESLDFNTNGLDIITNVAQILGLNDFDPDFRAVDMSQAGNITGTVTDANGQTYAFAEVYVEANDDLDGDGDADDVTTYTDANGNFTLLALPPGTYTVHAKAQDGTELTSDTSVTVQAGGEVQVTAFHIN